MSDTNVADQLIALGVPRHVAAYVAEQKPLRIPLLASAGYMAVLIGGFAVGGLWLWPLLEARLDQNAIKAAEASGALLYHHNFGVGLLIAIFAWIGAAGVIIGAIPMLHPRLAAGEFYESIVGAASAGNAASARTAHWGVLRLMEGLKGETDPARYVSQATFAWVKPVAAIAAVALVFAGLVTLREVNAYTLYFADRYEQRHTFFLPSPTIHSWSDATRVEVGCNHVTGENAGDDPVYQVHFRSGGSTRIDGAFPVSRTWIDQVEIIDAALVSAGANFEPWSWLSRDAYHPRCLMAYATWLSEEDYARFERLIRAPQQARDVPRD